MIPPIKRIIQNIIQKIQIKANGNGEKKA